MVDSIPAPTANASMKVVGAALDLFNLTPSHRQPRVRELLEAVLFEINAGQEDQDRAARRAHLRVIK